MELSAQNVHDVLVVKVLSDAIDASNAKEFKLQMAPLMSPGAQVILDLGALKFVDSSGLGAILSCLRQLNSVNGNLKLSGMARPVRALFELVRMHRVFEIFNTQEEAVHSFEINFPSPVNVGS